MWYLARRYYSINKPLTECYTKCSVMDWLLPLCAGLDLSWSDSSLQVKTRHVFPSSKQSYNIMTK